RQYLLSCRERLRLRAGQLNAIARRYGVNIDGARAAMRGCSIAAFLDIASSSLLLCGIGYSLYSRGTEAIRLYCFSGACLAIFCLLIALQGKSRLLSILAQARPILYHLWIGYFLGLGCFHSASLETSFDGDDAGRRIAIGGIRAKPIVVGPLHPISSESVEQTINCLMLLSVLASMLRSVIVRIVYPLTVSRRQSAAAGADATLPKTVDDLTAADGSEGLIGEAIGTGRDSGSSQYCSLLSKQELWEQIGFSISLIEQSHWWELALFNACLCLTIVLLRLRSWLAVANALLLSAACVYLLHSIQLHASLTPLLMYLYRQLGAALIDSGSASVVELWWSAWQRWYLHHIVYAMLLCLDISALAIGATVVVAHPQHVLMLPFYAVSACPYLAFHLARLLLLHQFTRRLCRLFRQFESKPTAQSAPALLAARGLRYLAQLGCRLLWLSLSSSCLLVCLTWETRSPASLALLAIGISCDAVLLATCTRLTECIGGTCLAYGLVSPELPPGASTGFFNNVGGGGGSGSTVVLLQSPTAHREQLARCTRQLDSIQYFFSSHLLTSFGCDLNSSGLSRDLVQQKLRQFFCQRTPDKQRYDTYVVYYCGPTDSAGAWAFFGGACLGLEALLQLWREAATASEDSASASDDEEGRGDESRLLLVVDSSNGHRWLSAVRSLPRNVCLALQTHNGQLEEFTKLFTSECEQAAAQQQELLRAAKTGKRPGRLGLQYAVSRAWVDFKLTRPSQSGARQFWDSALPRPCRCLLPALTASCPLLRAPSLRLVSPLCNAVRRLRMRLCPPAALDTGLGFRLVQL
ncbi:hypothetical protein BOX15_Mlig018248g2, partial [Macrostomum lignano]